MYFICKNLRSCLLLHNILFYFLFFKIVYKFAKRENLYPYFFIKFNKHIFSIKTAIFNFLICHLSFFCKIYLFYFFKLVKGQWYFFWYGGEKKKIAWNLLKIFFFFYKKVTAPKRLGHLFNIVIQLVVFIINLEYYIWKENLFLMVQKR